MSMTPMNKMAQFMMRMQGAKSAIEDRSGGREKAVQIPTGVRNIKLTVNTFVLDFLPYVVKTDSHPQKIPQGEEWWMTQFYIHRNVGAMGATYTCPSATWGLPCPVCEELLRVRNRPDVTKKQISQLRPSGRMLSYVADHTKLQDGIGLLNQSLGEFAKMLSATHAVNAEDVGIFFDLDEGRSVRVVMEEAQGDSFKYAAPSAFGFPKRVNAFTPEFREAVAALPDLDSLIINTPYDEMDRVFNGGGAATPQAEPEKLKPTIEVAEEDELPPPPRQARAKPAPKTSQPVDLSRGAEGDDDDDEAAWDD